MKSLNFSTSVQVGERPVHDLHLGELLRGGRDYAVSDGRALLHLLPAGYTLDGATAIRDPRGMVGGELSLDLHAITADDGPLRNIALLLDRCHLRVARLIASPYASALATVRSDEKDLGTTIIDIGGGTSKLALYAGGHFIYSDTIALGGDLLTYALAQQASMPLRDAERIKTLHGSLFSAPKDRDSLIGHNVIGGTSMAEDHITKAELTAILREKSFYMLNVIKHRLDKSGFGAYSGQRLVLTGGGAQLSGMCEFASDIFQKPTRLGAPSALPGLPREALAPAFATSLGLYQAFVSYDAVNEKLNQPLKSYTRGTFSRVSKWLKESF